VADVSLVTGDGIQLRNYMKIKTLVKQIHQTQNTFDYFDSRAKKTLSAEQEELVEGLKKSMKVLLYTMHYH
jgi:hypothetical protein